MNTVSSDYNNNNKESIHEDDLPVISNKKDNLYKSR